jgi:hypothetical protein
MTGIISRRRNDRWFFPLMALLLVVYVLLGFWPSYIGAGLVFAKLPSALVHIHSVLYVGWMALFGTQIALVETRHVPTHRKLGILMGVWAAAMVLIGPATAVMALRREPAGLSAGGFAGDLAQTVAFAILISAGFARRGSAPEHKRLMTLASAAIIGPALARWPFDFIQNGPPVALAFLYILQPLLLVAYDLSTQRRVQRATGFGLGVMLLVLICFLTLPAWSGWQAFTSWVAHFR